MWGGDGPLPLQSELLAGSEEGPLPALAGPAPLPPARPSSSPLCLVQGRAKLPAAGGERRGWGKEPRRARLALPEPARPLPAAFPLFPSPGAAAEVAAAPAGSFAKELPGLGKELVTPQRAAPPRRTGQKEALNHPGEEETRHQRGAQRGLLGGCRRSRDCPPPLTA